LIDANGTPHLLEATLAGQLPFSDSELSASWGTILNFSR
jgi:hypothetical protein